MHALTVHLLSSSVPQPQGLSRGDVPEVTLTGDAGSEEQNSYSFWQVRGVRESFRIRR